MTPTDRPGELEEGVREIVGRISARDVAALGPDDDLVEKLGVDSLQGLQILAGVEKRFGVRLPDGELITLRTMGRIRDAVSRVQKAGG